MSIIKPSPRSLTAKSEQIGATVTLRTSLVDIKYRRARVASSCPCGGCSEYILEYLGEDNDSTEP